MKLGLELDSLLSYLEYLHDKHDFNVLSISGGEPFLYKHLGEVLSAAKSMGYFNQMVSNGMLLKSKRNQEMLKYVDSIAISIDGNRELHNEMRASEKAYDKMLEGIKVIKDHGVNFGLIHTLTKKSWPLIPELHESALNNGARLLQMHPIENTGRASNALNDQFFLDEEDLHKIFILVSILKANSPISIQLDLLHKQILSLNPGIVFGDIQEVNRIQDLMKDLVITEQGKVLPISYGFSEDFLIHNIHLNRGENSIEKFMETKGTRLKSLLNNTFQ
ncbi:MAG: radical SAM protein, partial [Bacteroidota bacterium]